MTDVAIAVPPRRGRGRPRKEAAAVPPRAPAPLTVAADLVLAPEQRERYLYRLKMQRDTAKSERLQRIEKERCRRDPVYFINTYCWTFDPRRAGLPDQAAWMPFLLYPKQEDLVQWLQARLAAREEGLCEKSRDTGFSWTVGGFLIHQWLFVRGFSGTYTSYHENKVDHLGVLDSFFEKMRQLFYLLPSWFMPAGFLPQRDDNFMRLVNPENQNTITGEVGDQVGRGGRSTILIVDEAAFVDHCERIDAATAANADCRIWGSTVNGMGNMFAKKRHGTSLKPHQIFRIHYTDDPRKDEAWAAKKRNDMASTPWAFASEYDIDYSASVEGVCIPARWVQAAVKLHKIITIMPSEKARAGLDIGAGKAQSALVVRRGPVVS